MSRKTAKDIIVSTNLKCKKAYPTEDSKKQINELESIGIKLTKEQAINMARTLLAVTQEWDNIDITAYRFRKNKSDNTYPITITSNLK